MREPKPLLKVAKKSHQNYVERKTDKTQQNNKCRSYEDRDEMINHIISECSKLAEKEYKTGYNWIGKVIP